VAADLVLAAHTYANAPAEMAGRRAAGLDQRRSVITALIPHRQGLLPSVRVFIDHLAAEFPKPVLIDKPEGQK